MISKLSNLGETDKIVIDVFSITTLAAALTSIVTPLAAILTLLWSGVRLYETDTVQKLLRRKDVTDK